MKRALLGILVLAGIWLLTPACGGDDAAVPTASCQACAGKSYSEADCKAAGEAAGCETSAFQATVGGGCNNGCSFTNCSRPPTCGSSTPPKDAGGGDAAVDPKCAEGPNGLFSTTPPCSDPSTVEINGAKRYACKCSSACPCNFECGSIALATGGVLGNVCAPPK